MADLLVRGGMLVDGTRAPARRAADVRIRAGRIVEVGTPLARDGEPELDASGAFVTPGFIETHTHVDPSLCWDRSCDPLPLHGVTTVLAGNCSLSLAPVHAADRERVTRVFCHVEDLPRAVFDAGVPWCWETFGELRAHLDSDGMAVDAALLVGHTPLRMWVMGDEAWERPATDDERRALAATLDRALAEGAFGLSTSRFDEDPDKRPVPSVHADEAELGALTDVLARHRAHLQFIPPQDGLRVMGDDVERWAARVGPRDVHASWIGLFHTERSFERSMAMLDRAAELQRSGTHVYPQVSPRTLDLRADFHGGIGFMHLADGWHRAVQADRATKRALLADPQWRATARAEWDAVPRTIFAHKRPECVRLISVSNRALEPWVGRTFAELIADRGGHPSDVLADWLLENDLDAGVVSVGVSNADADGVAAMLTHPGAVISNSDAGAHVQMFCAAGDTTLLLTRHVRDRGDLTLEDAVWHLTVRQADVFGFDGRGVVAPGFRGDLTVFDLDELAWRDDVFVADLPTGAARLRRPPGGYRATVVAGEITQLEGAATGARPGRVVARERGDTTK